MHIPAVDAAHGNKATILNVADAVKRGDPESPASILKKRTRDKPIEFPFAAVVRNDLPVSPSVQGTIGADPDAAIPGRQYGPNDGVRQTLLHRERADGQAVKAVESV